jgi:hypothetical protein
MFICNTLNHSPKQLLRILLQKSISSAKKSTIRDFLSQNQTVSSQNQGLREQDRLFEVKRTRDGYPVRYISPIAHRLGATSTQSVSDLAEELAIQLLIDQSQSVENFSPALPKAVLQGLTIQSTATGYMQFDFSDPAIAQYFTLVLHSLPGTAESSRAGSELFSAIPQWSERIFRLQYTHARCCSLLRLAHQNHFIQLNLDTSEDQIDRWQIMVPAVLPWLTATLQFRTNHVTELQLIAQIVTVLDALADWSGDPLRSSTLPECASTAALQTGVVTLLTTGEGLSQAAHASQRHWQLMGNLREQERDRLQAHLGLILITQRLLYQLLQTHLAIEAPFTL